MFSRLSILALAIFTTVVIASLATPPKYRLGPMMSLGMKITDGDQTHIEQFNTTLHLGDNLAPFVSGLVVGPGILTTEKVILSACAEVVTIEDVGDFWFIRLCSQSADDRAEPLDCINSISFVAPGTTVTSYFKFDASTGDTEHKISVGGQDMVLMWKAAGMPKQARFEMLCRGECVAAQLTTPALKYTSTSLLLNTASLDMISGERHLQEYLSDWLTVIAAIGDRGVVFSDIEIKSLIWEEHWSSAVISWLFWAWEIYNHYASTIAIFSSIMWLFREFREMR